MSKAAAKERRREFGWVEKPPRCGNCKHFVHPWYVLEGSIPRWFEPVCTLGGFKSQANSTCAMWEKGEPKKHPAGEVK